MYMYMYVQGLAFSADPLLIRYTMIQLLTLDTWTDDIARWVIGTYNFEEKTIEDGVFYYCLFFVGFIGIGVFVFWSPGCSVASFVF